MSKYLPSSASNNTSITKVNKSNNIKNLDFDELDNALCPPALSPYALSILDDKLNKNNCKDKNKIDKRDEKLENFNRFDRLNTNSQLQLQSQLQSQSRSQSKQNTITSFNEITKTSKLNSMNNLINSATNTSISRHSKFMKKLNLGAPRRLTNDGDFQISQSSRKSIDNISQLRISNNNDYNILNDSTINRQHKDLNPETKNFTDSKNDYFININNNNNNNKENEFLETNKDRKHSLQITPFKYSPIHKRITISTNKENIKQIIDSPIRNKNNLNVSQNPLIDSPEIGRKKVIDINNNKNKEFLINENILGLFDSKIDNKNTLNLNDITDRNINSKSNENNDQNFEQLQNILDKKKEIYLLKQEIKRYKLELEKQKQNQEIELLEREKEKKNNEKKIETEKELDNNNENNKLININKHKYKLFEQIGKGGSSKVYRASVVDSQNRYLAIKIVNLEDQELSTITELKGEIKILHKLRHCPRVVRLLDYSLTTKRIYFVMECGDLDLATVLSNRHLMKRFYDLEFIRYHAQEMIKCINAIHEMDVVHLDLKPANFVFVSGVLKLIDFGISNSIKGHTVNVYREYQMGTPNYMAPETLLDCAESENGSSIWKVGKPADIWSLGCILYQLTYGATPYASYTGTKKILAITNPSINISYPNKAINLRKRSTNSVTNINNNNQNDIINDDDDDIKVCPYLIDMIRKCLIRDPTKRITCKELINNIFINPVVVDKTVIKEVVRGCVGFGGRHPELKNVALGTNKNNENNDIISKEDKRAQERIDRLIDGVWSRVSNEKTNN